MQILIGLTEHHLNRETHNTETQTTSVPPYRESLGKCNLCKSPQIFSYWYMVWLYVYCMNGFTLLLTQMQPKVVMSKGHVCH